jgi:hypothetical protein
MASMKDALLGRIAVEKGMITDAQLEQALREQDRSPRTLGEILVAKGLLDDAKLAGILEEQERRIQALDQFKQMQKVEYLFGQLLVKNNLATQLQINKCLEIQQKMAERGMQPVPRLGELLLDHGFVDRRTVTEMLKLQDKDVLFCTACARQYNVVGAEPGRDYKCKQCAGPLVRQAKLDSLRAEDTMFGFELPS